MTKKNSIEQATPARSSTLLTKQTRPRLFTFILALTSLCLLWISFPPLGVWWLAWLAPVPLIWLVSMPTLPGTQPYREIWMAGFIYWLATFYFIPIPHWALWFGWIAVCLYMSIYTPLFVVITRRMVHQYRVPIVLAVPIVWTGIEWFRCNFATGMAMACLSHTQYQHPTLIQIADLSGAYTLTFAMTMFAAGVAIATGRWVTISTGSRAINRTMTPSAAIFLSALVVAGVTGYGQFRLNQRFEAGQKSIRIALIQSSIDVVFEDISLTEKTRRFEQYCQLTLAARQQWPDLDLIVWPESSFPTADLLSDFNDEQTAERFRVAISDAWLVATESGSSFPDSVPLLASVVTADPANHDGMFNSAVLIRDPGVITDRYYKNHLVMFGEYVPFADWIPILKQSTPIGSGFKAGHEFATFDVNGVAICPSICFESTIPHLMRRMVNTLEDESDSEPDVLINLTNDGWFFGTSCLDLHLACNVFRAVELRKPHLVCANTGFSAEIDSNGRLLQVGKRRNVDLLKAEVSPVKRESLYRLIGDVIPAIWGGVCVFVWVLILKNPRTPGNFAAPN